MVFNTHWQNFLDQLLIDNYLTFRSVSGNNFGLCTGLNDTADPKWDGAMYYSTDGISWAVWDGGPIYSVNGVLYLRGEGNTKITGYQNSAVGSFKPTNSSLRVAITCSGNIESLLDWRTVGRGGHPVMANYAFTYLFLHLGRSLVSGPELLSPVTSRGCYDDLFQGCSNMVTGPSVLPAAVVAQNAYDSMFSGCSSLITTPEIRATEIQSQGCQSMFYECTSLTTAPVLSATTLAYRCYSFMFYGCTSLTAAPALPATTLAQNCYQHMFSDCTSLTTPPALPATTLAQGCYQGMFSGCTSLATIPAIPYQAGVYQAYNVMFGSCTQLIFSSTQTAGSTYYYTGENSNLGNDSIFDDTDGGSFTDTVEGVDYYTTAQVI